jgi:hypothetical protein
MIVSKKALPELESQKTRSVTSFDCLKFFAFGFPHGVRVEYSGAQRYAISANGSERCFYDSAYYLDFQADDPKNFGQATVVLELYRWGRAEEEISIRVRKGAVCNPAGQNSAH